MTISDYLASSDYPLSFAEILMQAKEKNASNPALLRRDDEYIESCQNTAFAKSFK